MDDKTNRKTHHRRTIRLAGHDYASEGGYFITIVTHGRLCLFGEALSQKTLGGAKTAIVDGQMRLTDFGKIVWEEWFKTANLRPMVELFKEEFVVMPNHIHGIVWINDDGQDGKIINSMGNNRQTVGAYSTTRFARVRIIRAIHPYNHHHEQLVPLSVVF